MNYAGKTALSMLIIAATILVGSVLGLQYTLLATALVVIVTGILACFVLSSILLSVSLAVFAVSLLTLVGGTLPLKIEISNELLSHISSIVQNMSLYAVLLSIPALTLALIMLKSIVLREKFTDIVLYRIKEFGVRGRVYDVMATMSLIISLHALLTIYLNVPTLLILCSLLLWMVVTLVNPPKTKERLAIASLSIAGPIMVPLALALAVDRSIVYALQCEVPEGVGIGSIEAVLVKNPVDRYALVEIGDTNEWGWERVRSSLTYKYSPQHHSNPHIIVFGASGTGKSELMKSIIAKLTSTGIVEKVFVIDFHGEYSNLKDFTDVDVVDVGGYGINILELGGKSPRDRAYEVAESFQKALNLGPLQRIMLQKIIEEAYAEKGVVEDDRESWNCEPPSLQDVVKAAVKLSASSAVSPKERKVIESLITYLSHLARVHAAKPPLAIANIISSASRGIVVFDLSSVPVEELKTIYADIILRRMMEYAMQRKEQEQVLIVIDEAHRVLPKGIAKETVVSKMIRELRKYKIGVALITQNPRDLEESIVLNAAVKICFAMNEPKSLEYTSKLLSKYTVQGRVNAIKKALASLPRGYAIVTDDLLKDPIIIKTATLWK